MLALAALAARALGRGRAGRLPRGDRGASVRHDGRGDRGVAELAPGIVSAGLGTVPAAQTFLDVGQGNRVNEDLYDGDLPRLYVRDGAVPRRLWERTLERADSAPANIVPGLLASTLTDAGVPVAAEADSGLATLIAVDRDGVVPDRRPATLRGGLRPRRSASFARQARRAARARRGARTRRPADRDRRRRAAPTQELLPIGIAGRGVRRQPDLGLDPHRRGRDDHRHRPDGARAPRGRGARRDERQRDHARATSATRRRSPSCRTGSTRAPAGRRSRCCRSAIWLALCGARGAASGAGRGARVALRLLGLACAWAPSLLLRRGRARRRHAGLGAARRDRLGGARRGHRPPVAGLRAASRSPARSPSAPTRSTWSPARR